MLSNSFGKRRIQDGRCGSSIVEFALAFSLLWTCLSGVFQFGHAMYLYNALTIAVQNGAQYSILVDFDSPAHTFVQKIQNAVVYGNPQGGLNPLVPGLLTSKVSVAWTTDASGIPQTITTYIQGYTCNAIFSTFTWTGKPSATVRFMGRFKS